MIANQDRRNLQKRSEDSSRILLFATRFHISLNVLPMAPFTDQDVVIIEDDDDQDVVVIDDDDDQSNDEDDEGDVEIIEFSE